MARLPQPGADSGSWGTILNEYLAVSHKSDGGIKDGAVTATSLAAGAVTSAAIADSSINEALLDPIVQTKLNAAAVIADGSIAKVKLESTIQTTLDRADSAVQPTALSGFYTKPLNGIPLADLNKTELDATYAPSNIISLPDGGNTGQIVTKLDGGE